MSIVATIVNLSQDMDLESGEMSNFVLLRLPSGTLLRALIDDRATEEIVRLVVAEKGAALPDPLEIQAVEAPELEEEDSRGVELPPSPRGRLRVDKDDLGYPIVSSEGMIDPRELTGGRDRDEDGVGQV